MYSNIRYKLQTKLIPIYSWFTSPFEINIISTKIFVSQSADVALFIRKVRISNILKANFNKRISPVTGLEWPRGFQEVKVNQARYRPGVAQRVPGN